MKLTKNLSNLDKLLRTGLGGVCIYLGFFDNAYLEQGAFSYVVGVFGIINLASALVSHCPVYQLAGINTTASHQSTSANLKLRNRLLGSFIFVAVTLIALFGFISFHIAKQFSLAEEMQLWEEFAHERAKYISSAYHLDNLETSILPDVADAVIVDNKLKPLNSIPVFLTEDEFQQIVINSKHDMAKEHSGSVEKDDKIIIWGMAPIPNTQQHLMVFQNTDINSGSLPVLAKQFMISATILLWFSIWGALIFSSVVSKRINKQNDIIVYQALHDSMTGLPNRKYLVDKVEKHIKAHQLDDKPLALCIFDINRFKDINDMLGFRSGDYLLKELAQRLGKVLKPTCVLARLDGVKFAIFSPYFNDQRLVEFVGDIFQVFDVPFMVDSLEIQCEISMGISIYHARDKDPMCMFRQAELAMYQAKKRNQEYVVYSPETDVRDTRKLTVISELRHAINNNELRLHYQPKINIQKGRTVSLEALIRWEHPKQGLQYPDTFIPQAEQTGLIKPLTMWTVREALRQLKCLKQMGLGLPIAVNFSQRLLSHENLTKEIENLLNEFDIEPGYFELEITESAAMSEAGGALKMINALSEIGIPLSLDDFGTGFTSMSHIRNLPIQTIKIDKSFVMHLADNEKDQKIVNSIVQFAHNMGHQVVAEGIENKEAWDILDAMGCDIGQGYFMSRPMSADEVANWLMTSDWPLGRNIVCEKALVKVSGK